jgi:PAS domain S-box-containing protein
MKTTLPGIFERAFPGLFVPDNNHGKAKHAGLSDDFFFQLAQNTRDIIFHAQLIPEFKFDYVSPSCYTLTGYTPEEFYADHQLMNKITHPDDADLVWFPDPDNSQTPGEPIVFRLVHKDGGIIWTEHLFTFKKDREGHNLSCQIIARDVTERVKAEEALQENRLFIDSLLEHAPHATVVINPDTSIRYVNPAWERLNGWTLQEVVGVKAPYPWWPEDGREEWLKMFLESLKQSSGQGELPSYKKNGEMYWIGVTWAAVYKNGKVDYYLNNSVDITERINAQQALKDSEAKFSLVFQSSPDIMAITRVRDGKFIEVNESFIRVTGHSREEAIGHTPDELNSWASQDDFNRIMKIFKEQGRVYNEECLFNTRYNGIRTILFSMEKIKIGDELCYMSVSNDITERKKAEAASRQSEEKFAKAFNSSPTAICIFSREDNKFVDVNDSYCRFAGYRREEIVNHTPNELNLWVSQDEMAKMSRNLRETGMLVNERIRTRMKSGDIRTGLFSAQAFEIADKKHMILSITDVTDQEQTNAALYESEEKFAKAFRDSPEIIAITTIKDGRFVDANESYLKATGYSLEELIGSNTAQVNIWVNENELIERFRLILEHGQVRNKEYEFRTKAGDIRTWLYSAELITIGGETCLMSASIDITERKKMERELQESEEKFSRTFHSIPESISISRVSDGIFIEANNSFCQQRGLAHDKIIGHSASELGMWEAPGMRESMIREIQEKGKMSSRETNIEMTTGEKRTSLLSANIINFGSEPCLIVISTDITERKKMEQELANDTIRRRILIEQSSDGIVIIDQNGKVVEANNRFAEMLGYTAEEMTRLYVWDWEYISPPEKTKEMLASVGEAGDHFETKHHRKDGSVYDVEISTNGANINGQKLVFCVCRDITQRKQMENAMRESEQKFSLAFNASPHMIIITDIEASRYIEVNDSFVHGTGYSREELLSQKITDINMWDKPEQTESMLRMLEEKGCIRNELYDFRTKSGELRTWMCSVDIVSLGGKKCMLAVSADVTERKNAEEALWESEEKFASAFNASPISLSITRLRDAVYLEVNESYLRDKGYTREEVVGKTTFDVPVWASNEASQKLPVDLKAQGHVHNVEMQYVTKSGEKRTGLVSAELIKIGNEDCMLVLNNDITQQKQAEEQLRLLSSVTKQVTDSTIITDRNFNIQFVNQAAVDMFGYSFEELKGKKLSFFNEGTASEEVKTAIKNILKTGKTFEAVLTKRCKDGSNLICDCRLTPMYDEKGNIVNLIDVQRDITKQKEIEARLQEHKKLIDSILATMPEGVLVIDKKDRIILANKALHNILQVNSQTLNNQPLSEVLPQDQYLKIHRAVMSGGAENNTLEFRYSLLGVEKIVYCVIVKMGGDRTLITLSDISQEREKEEKLYLTDRLASIGQMAAGLAHELNNPLTGILTLSQLLINSHLPPENKEDIECIYAEAKRAAGIVKNVLLFARNKPEETGQASVNEVVKDVLRLREYEQRSSNIKVVTELAETLPNVLIDKGQLQQVFLNMISNAEAAVNETGHPGVITVITERTDGHINIHFTDNGTGIKKQVLPRIFDPFFTTKEVGKGTGLGLSICYSIVVKHGGKISVKSQENEGTTFTINLPVAS